MKRFISLDILRGTAIFLMVVFHVPMVWYDRGWLEGGQGISVHPLAFLLLLSLLFFGAWAGFFLLVSSASNMVSMQRNLEKGRDPWKMVMYQLIGGLLLLVSAFLVEAAIGYHGYAGELAVGSNRWDMVLWRGFHMETIHTIALCIMVNGLVMGLLSRKGGHRRTMRNVKAYLLLSGLVLLMTPLAYMAARTLYPGYPFAQEWSALAGRDLAVQYPVIGETPFPELIVKTFLAFAAGQPEPLFPYLSLSFFGSALGLMMCSRERSRHLPMFGGLLGAALSVAGSTGLAATFISGKADIHRLADHFYELPGLYPDLWLWWFLLLSGAFVLSFVLVVRLVEMRGRSRTFARPTLFLRRYGLVAFTVYTLQFVYVIPRLALEVVPQVRSAYPFPGRMGIVPVLVMTIMTVLLWEALLRSWQRAHFTFTMEWSLAKVGELLVPSKRSGAEGIGRRPWYWTPRLDHRGLLEDPEWVELVPERGRDLRKGRDSSLSLLLSALGSFIPLLLPISIPLALSARREEGRRWTNLLALCIGIGLSVVWSVLLLALLFAPRITV